MSCTMRQRQWDPWHLSGHTVQPNGELQGRQQISQEVSNKKTPDVNFRLSNANTQKISVELRPLRRPGAQGVIVDT